jgi:drug/metabolite transporter (DMT)-like permease
MMHEGRRHHRKSVRAAAVALLGLSSLATRQCCRAFTPRLSWRSFTTGSATSPSQSFRLAYSALSTDRDAPKEASESVTDEEISSLLQDLQRQHELLQQSMEEEEEVGGSDQCTDAPQNPLQETKAASSLAAASTQSPEEQAVVRARWLLLGAAALYGTNFSLVKLLGQAHLPVGASSTLRFGMAALATFPWLLPSRDHGEESPTQQQTRQFTLTHEQWQAARLGFEVGVYNAIGYVAQAVGLETTAASKSAFLCSLAVVVVPLLDFLSGKQISRQQMIGTLLAIIGVAVLELGDVFASGTGLQLTSGDLASLIQPICFGLGFWKMEKCMQRHPEQANRSTAAQLLAVFLGSWLYSSIAEPGALNMAQATEWLSQPQVLFGLFWTGCITTALTVYMETLALKTLSAAETTLIFSTEPLWGTLFASLVMGEQLGVDSATGAALILMGCLFSNLGIDGIKDTLSLRKDTIKLKDHMASETETAATNDAPASSKSSTPLSHVRAGLTTTFRGLAGLASGLWTNVAIGTAVLAMDIEDVMDEIMNKVDL